MSKMASHSLSKLYYITGLKCLHMAIVDKIEVPPQGVNQRLGVATIFKEQPKTLLFQTSFLVSRFKKNHRKRLKTVKKLFNQLSCARST